MNEFKKEETKNKKNKEDNYTVIRKFNNKGESFQKIMEKILIRRINKI